MNLIIITFVSILISSSNLVQSQEPSSSRDNLEPTIQIVILVHPYNKYLYLPHVLGGLESQTYPKDRIRLRLLTERIFYEESYYDHPGAAPLLYDRETRFEILDDRIRQNDLTIEMLKRWVRLNRPYYNELDLSISNVQLTEKLFGEGGGGGGATQKTNTNSYWNKDRFKFLIDTKNQELYHAYQSFVDFVLFIDSDVILVEQNLLSNLTKLFADNPEMVVTAPMLYSSGTYSNFWAGMDAKGYYVRTEDYLPILERKQTGTFAVPMVHTCFMVDTRKRASRELTFDPIEVEGMVGSPIPYDDIIAFAKSAAKSGVTLYVDNRYVWGYIPQPISDSGFNPQNRIPDSELKQTLVDLELESLVEGPPFPLSPILESYLEPLQEQSDRLGVDQIYVINLGRRFERRKRMEASLKLLQVQFRLYEAVDGKRLTQEYLDKHRIRSLEGYVDPYHKRLMTFGEFGCFLSHYRIWEDAWRMNYTKIVILEDDVRFEKNFRAKFSETLKRFSALEAEEGYDFLYLGRKLNGDLAAEEELDSGFFVRPGYSYWTIGYMISRDGIGKLLHANPLGRMIPVDEFLPIMYGGHLNATLVKMYDRIEHLKALSLRQLIVYPTHYVGDAAYISDTEDSDKVSDKNTAAEVPEEEEDKTNVIDRSFRGGKLVGEPQPPPSSASYSSSSTSAYLGHLEL